MAQDIEITSALWKPVRNNERIKIEDLFLEGLAQDLTQKATCKPSQLCLPCSDLASSAPRAEVYLPCHARGTQRGWDPLGATLRGSWAGRGHLGKAGGTQGLQELQEQHFAVCTLDTSYRPGQEKPILDSGGQNITTCMSRSC